jgi:hypothetical protein
MATDWRVEGSEFEDFSPLDVVQTGSDAYPMSTGSAFSGVKLTTYLLLLPGSTAGGYVFKV